MTDMIAEITKGIVAFKVSLPQNPLRWLNTYVVLGNGISRNLLIDTGFHREECLMDLLKGIKTLGLNPQETDVFITHTHSDHAGNAYELCELGCRILMGSKDYKILNTNTWPERKQRALLEGMPPDVMKTVFEHNPAVLYAPKPFEADTIEPGGILSYGGYDFEAVHTPGHTPGHICLRETSGELIFLGDHILFDITPNISFWIESDDSLGDYLTSLSKFHNARETIALPSHRTRGEVSLAERARALTTHHEKRLAETEKIVKRTPGLTAYEIAGRMTWKIKAKDWNDFPPGQKWFAMGEALSHLDYLTRRDRVYSETTGSYRVYY